ncbi:Guanine nucleotide exchange protein smcr8 [Actinomortierella ambigua]|uniref:Guanine nucleotide exchange protein smcr8 n=1 Tax=Actinomortierella ambigua TaxID=1343610 RepID=A0A9P6QEM8_9FUNG|nr:Guanine nucleotide exchange protein smcr8 [Actinomortierella ambigua]
MNSIQTGTPTNSGVATAAPTSTTPGSTHALPAPPAASKGVLRSTADQPSISVPSSSTITAASSPSSSSPATRQGAFRRRRPVAATSTSGSVSADPSGPDASKSPSLHLDDRPTCWWYTKGSTSIESDFVLIAEFSEIEGPRAVMTIPDNIIDLTFDSFAAAKQKENTSLDAGAATSSSARDQQQQQRQRAFDVHEYVLRITSVDHQSREMSDSFHIPEDIEVYICESEQQYWAYVHHFTLFDVNARGFVRPFNISYITKDPNKILPNYEDIRRKFSKAVQYFKMGNYALFRHELTRKLKDLNYTSNLLSGANDAAEKTSSDEPKGEEEGPGPRQPADQDHLSVLSPGTPHDSSNGNGNDSNTNVSDGNVLHEDNSDTLKPAEAGSSLAAIESTKAELASIKDAIEQATQIISMLEHYSIDGQPLLGHPDESGESVHAAAAGTAPAPLSEVSPMNSSENLASIAAGRSAALNDMSLFLGAQGRSGLRIRRKGSAHNVGRILEVGGGAGGMGAVSSGGTTTTSAAATMMVDTTNLSASSPLLSGLQEQSRKNSIVSEYESTMQHEPEYEPQFITTLYPVARDEIVFRTLRELCVTPMFWNSSIYFHLGIKKLKDILKDYHDDALLLKQTADDLRRMHPTSSTLTVGRRFQINFRNPDFITTTTTTTTNTTAARPSSPLPLHHDEPSPVPLIGLLHGISMANTLSDDGDSTISFARQSQPPTTSKAPTTTTAAATTLLGAATASPSSLMPVTATSATPAIATAPVPPAGVPPPPASVAGHFDADDADDEETGYDSLDDTSSFFTAVTGPYAVGGPFMDPPASRDSFTGTSMVVDRSARVVEWRQEQHSLRHKRSSRTLPGGDLSSGLPSDQHVQATHPTHPLLPPPLSTTFAAGVTTRDLQQPSASFHSSLLGHRLSDGAIGPVRLNRLSGQCGAGVGGGGGTTMTPGGGGGGGASGYAGGSSMTTRIPLSGTLVLQTLQDECATAKHVLFALWSGKRVCITGGVEHEARIRQYVAVLSVFVPHVGFPTREEQLLEHQRQVVPWHQGYDLLRASDFSTTTTTTTTTTMNATPKLTPTVTGSPPPAPISPTPPLLLVGVDRTRLEPAVLERKDILTVNLDTQETMEQQHSLAVEYADGLVLEKIFRSVDQGLFSDDGSFLAFVDSTLFDELLLKAFLYYHLVLRHRIFQHPHLLQHRHGNGGGGGGGVGGGGVGPGGVGSGYGNGFYSSACSDDGETFSYLRSYRRPSRQQSPPSSTKMMAAAVAAAAATTAAGGGGGSKQSRALPSSSSSSTLLPTGRRGVDSSSTKRGTMGATTKSAGRKGAGPFSSRESSDTEKAAKHYPPSSRKNTSGSNGYGLHGKVGREPPYHAMGTTTTAMAATTTTAPSSHMDWTRRLGKRTSKGKERHRQPQHRTTTSSGRAEFVDDWDEGDEVEHGEGEEEGDVDDLDDKQHREGGIHPMQYTTMQGMRKWKKWFDYWSAKSAAVIDPALAVFGKPDSQKGGGRGDRDRDRERSSRPSSRRSSPNGHGHRRGKAAAATGGAHSDGGHALQQQQQHHLAPRHREYRERNEREKERDQRRDRERDSKATGAHFDNMRHYNGLSNCSDDDGHEGEGEDEEEEEEEEIEVLSPRRLSSSHSRTTTASSVIGTDKDLPSLPAANRKGSQGHNGGVAVHAGDEVGLGITSHDATGAGDGAATSSSRKGQSNHSQNHGNNHHPHHHHHHHHHLSSALRRLHSASSRKLQPKVPLSLQPIKQGSSGGTEGETEGPSSSGIGSSHPTASTTTTTTATTMTSPQTSPTGSGTLRGLTSALRGAMSFGSAFGAPTATTSTTAVVATATTTTTAMSPTLSSSSPPIASQSLSLSLSSSSSSSSSSLLSPTLTKSRMGSMGEELSPSDRCSSEAATTNAAAVAAAEGNVKRRGSKRAKAKAWLEAKRKKHWHHRHGSKCSVPCTAGEEEGEEGEGEGEGEGEEEEGEEEDREGEEDDEDEEEMEVVGDRRVGGGGDMQRSHAIEDGQEVKDPEDDDPEAIAAVESGGGHPVRYPSDRTITGVEPSFSSSSAPGEESTTSTATTTTTTAKTKMKSKKVKKKSPVMTGAGASDEAAAAADMADMLTIEEIAQLEPTRFSMRSASSPSLAPPPLPLPLEPSPPALAPPPLPPRPRRSTTTVAMGDVSGRESATEYETSMETWATHADRQKEEEEARGKGKGKGDRGARPWEDEAGEETAEDAGESTATPATATATALDHQGATSSRPSLEADPFELTEEVLAVVRELIGGVSGEDDWAIIVYLAKLVYAYEKVKEATASPSSDK